MQNNSTLYDENYYKTGLGTPYERASRWLNFFGTIADEVIRSLRPQTVFDAGCAMGFLVESFCDRGVEAYGIDISEYAISQVRRDMQQYCRVASILDPIEGRYDLIACIEVLEHLLPIQTETAIANLASATDTILFSSSPTDIAEATHFNVKPTIGWLNLFKNAGFWPDYGFDASFVAPHAMLLRKRDPIAEDALLLLSEKLRLKSVSREQEAQVDRLNQTISELTAALGELKQAEQVRLDGSPHIAEILRTAEVQTVSPQLLADAVTPMMRRLDEVHKVLRELTTELCDASDRGKSSSREHQTLLANVQLAEARLNKLKSETELLRRVQAEKQAALDSATSASLLAQTEIRNLRDELAETLSCIGPAIPQLAIETIKQELTPLSAMFSRLLKQSIWAVTFRRSGLQRKKRLLLDQAQKVASSQLFEAAWYLRTYPDVAASDQNPLIHYLECGGVEGRNPGPRFDAQWYLNRYPDVAAANLNPLVHYLEFGAIEGRQLRSVGLDAVPSDGGQLSSAELLLASSYFDPVWYLNNYPDVTDAGLDPVIHYLECGGHEGRNPGPRFDAAWYLQRYPDVSESGLNPLVHYLEFGAKEGRDIRSLASNSPPQDAELLRQFELISASPLFEPAWYLENNPDVQAAGLDPLVHYLEHGSDSGLSPGSKFDAKAYLKAYPDVADAKLNPLVHYLEYGAAENRAIQALPDVHGVDFLLDVQFSDAVPLPTFLIPRTRLRVTIVANSINTGSLYGGVGTALILSTQLAKALDADLRLVTRQEPAVAANFGKILAVNNVIWDNDIDFLYSPLDASRHVAVSESDIFLTTSWWTTNAVRSTVNPTKIFYLLQEDERMFYPFGDRRLRCEETLMADGIRFVVNSRLLFDHLISETDGLDSVRDRGCWFEPAFPESNYYPDRSASQHAKKQFFFYARPNNARNLYWRGVEVIRAAIERGVICPAEWEINFVGQELERLVLPGNFPIKKYQSMTWSEYAALVRRMDLGLCLMDTPHPSYPPLDLAASGAVVVTNKRGNKTSLSQYSENIFCADAGVEGLSMALAAAAELAGDDSARFSNYSRNGMFRNWNAALESTVKRLAEIIRSET